jgi:RNA-directed DNA polymerase
VPLILRRQRRQVSERQVYRVFRGRGYSSLVSLELGRICTRVDGATVRRADTRYTAIPLYSIEGPASLPQGGPTSGALANAVATPMDRALADLAEKQRFVYTRYSDDLVFSTGSDFAGKVL